jgi:hypothetical protein
MPKNEYDLFEFEAGIHLRPSEISDLNVDFLEQNEFLHRKIRKKTICLEAGCHNTASIHKIGEKYYVIDEVEHHCHIAKEDDYVLYEIKYEKLISHLLSQLFQSPEDFTIGREKEFFITSKCNIEILILCGKYTKAKIDNLTKFTLNNLEKGFLIFSKDASLRNHIKELISLIGVNIISISDLKKPSRAFKNDIQKKMEFFKSLKQLEENTFRKEPSINQETVIKIIRNPNYLSNELLSSYRTKDWDNYEELIKMSFGFLINFDISSFGGKNRGKSVPDGFGFSVDEENRPTKAFIIDSKSIGTEKRDKVSINFYESEKYLKYLRDLKELEKTHNIQDKILIFIAPEFNSEQIKKLSENVYNHADFKDYTICFMELLSLAMLLKLKHHFLIKRDFDLTTTVFREFLSIVFNIDEYIKLAKEFNTEIEKFKSLNYFTLEFNDLMKIIKKKLDFGRDRRKIFKEFEEISLSN